MRATARKLMVAALRDAHWVLLGTACLCAKPRRRGGFRCLRCLSRSQIRAALKAAGETLRGRA